MRGHEAELPEERVRRALGGLGADHASAPDVPPGVTAKIAAALRAASPPPAHTTSQRAVGRGAFASRETRAHPCRARATDIQVAATSWRGGLRGARATRSATCRDRKSTR